MNPWFIVAITVELIFLLIHTSVLLCILRQRAKGAVLFRSGFFAIYVVQSIADIVHYALVSRLQSQISFG